MDPETRDHEEMVEIQTARTTKKPYHKPELKRWGHVRDLTQQILTPDCGMGSLPPCD